MVEEEGSINSGAGACWDICTPERMGLERDSIEIKIN